MSTTAHTRFDVVRPMRPTEDAHRADEPALLLAAQAGDERVFGRLLDRHRGGLELYCYLMIGGDRDSARHLLEDAVLTAWRERGLIGPHTKARMWLYQVTTRVCIEAAGDQVSALGAADCLRGEP
jgi:DNA-directed RNA polymerase specialized sigma24 family protein